MLQVCVSDFTITSNNDDDDDDPINDSRFQHNTAPPCVTECAEICLDVWM